MAVYFIQADIGGPIKVGYTGRPVDQRLREHQCGSPFKLQIVGVIPEGTEWHEYELKKKFTAEGRKVHGEWFNLDGVENLHRVVRKSCAAKVKTTPPIPRMPHKPRTLPGPYWPLARAVIDALKISGPTYARELRLILGLDSSYKLVACLRMLGERGWVKNDRNYGAMGSQWEIVRG